MEQMKKLTARLKKVRKSSIILLLGFGGMLLILLSQLTGVPKAAGQEEKGSENHAEAYRTELEARLLSLIQKMDGVGKAELMITMDSGTEYLYVNEEKTSTDETEDADQESNKTQRRESNEKSVTVLGGTEALLQKEKEPTVRGVIVICEGGDDIKVERQITDAVTAALHITSARVCVAKMAATQQ